MKKKTNNKELVNEKYIINNSLNEINKLKEKTKNNIIRINSSRNIKLFLIISLFIRGLSNETISEIKFSNITLKIKEKGMNKIFCSDNNKFNKCYYPDEIYINTTKMDIINHTYNLDSDGDKIIILVWNKSINKSIHMFQDCYNITEIDLSNFDTSEIIQTSNMFQGCSKLTSINFSNFDTSKVTAMGYMFYDCSSLISLNLSSFNTSNVVYMRYTFYNCAQLVSLDLSNFDTSKVQYMNETFSGCKNLKYINLKNFNDFELTDIGLKNIFSNVPNNIVICINENNSKILNQIKQIKCSNIDCSDNWESKQKKEISNVNGCECELDNCLSCPFLEYSNMKICTQCNNNYFLIENNKTNIDGYNYCFKEPEGYYLDKDIYKNCYYTCKTCEIKGNNKTHNCLECNNIYPFRIEKNNYFNCFENCSYYYYFDSDYNYHCTSKESCPEDYSISNKDKRECIINNNFYFNNVIQNILNYDKNETKGNDKNMEEKVYNKILENIENIFTNNYDTTNLDKGEEQIIKAEKMTITLTTTNNQKNNHTNNDLSIIDLGECETLLRIFYNISNNEILYMKKIDVKQEKIKIPKVEYSVYRKLSDINLEKLNLSICNESKISILVPIKITESIDKLNSSSDYFNNICYKSKSDKGTDISLKDRQKEFVEGDKTVCQEKCDFSDYNTDTQRANCSCDVTESSTTNIEININKEKLYENFVDNKESISNFGVTSCNVLASKENIKGNTGFFLLLIILAFFIVIFIIFCSRGYNLLENKIDEIIHKKFKKEKNQYLI